MAPSSAEIHGWRQAAARGATQTDLVLVHIPKTGGTAMEEAAIKQRGIHWGIVYETAFRAVQVERACGLSDDSCYAQQRQASKTYRGPPLTPACLRANATCVKHMTMERGALVSCPNQEHRFAFHYHNEQHLAHAKSHCCPWWHIPPPMLRVDPRPYLLAPKRFCVVRDPYTRLFSDYFYRWKSKVFEYKSYREDFPEGVCRSNSTEARRAQSLLRGNFSFGGRGNIPSVSGWVHVLNRGHDYANLRQRDPLLWVPPLASSWSAFPGECHHVPQSSYLARRFIGVDQLSAFDRLTDPSDDKGCNIVLRYERLKSEFAALMAWARLRIVLKPPLTRVSLSSASCLTPAGARDLLQPTARAIVRRWYQRDFELLGYPD